MKIDMNMIAGKKEEARRPEPAMLSTATTAGQEHYVRVKYISSMSQESRNTYLHTHTTPKSIHQLDLHYLFDSTHLEAALCNISKAYSTTCPLRLSHTRHAGDTVTVASPNTKQHAI
jgi:hypothetical protein